MDAVTSGPNVKELVRIPALIALVVTLARLAGELAGGPAMLFNREPGGPGSLVGIVWLVPIFGIYFALKLARSGHAPQSAGKVIGFSLLALLAAAAIGFLVVKLTGDPNVGVSLRGVVGQQLGFGVAAVVALLILRRVWVPFFQTMLRYAFASRLPVVIVMLVTMIGGWGTHYELGPPGYPEMALPVKFVLIGLVPQLTFWVAFTVVVGSLVGGIAAALSRSKAAATD